MKHVASMHRTAAAAIGIVAWAGLAVQLNATAGISDSLLAASWSIARYFTIIGNAATAILFSAIALGSNRAATPRIVAGLALAQMLIGIVHFLLLRGVPFSGAHAWLADLLLHRITPVLVPLYWLAFSAKGRLRGGDPWRWAAFPIAYLVYALARAAVDGRYPYPFLDAGAFGWPRVALNIAAIAAGFMAAGHALVQLDRRLGGAFPANDSQLPSTRNEAP